MDLGSTQSARKRIADPSAVPTDYAIQSRRVLRTLIEAATNPPSAAQQSPAANGLACCGTLEKQNLATSV
jgi:hypothetical protein